MAMLTPLPRPKPQLPAQPQQPPPEPFVWGDGGVAMTPADVARKRAIAEQLAQEGTSTAPVQHWTQGLARVANALVGGLEERRANEAEQQGRQGFKDRFAKLQEAMRAPGADKNALLAQELAAIDDPYASESAKAYLSKQVAPDQANGPFAGSGFEASAANILVAGANDPAIRATPQYKLALADWQKTQMIPNAQGQMQIFRRDLPSDFSPGAESPQPQSQSAPASSAPDQTHIPGTGTLTTIPNTGKTPNEGQMKAGQYLTEGLFAAKTLDDPDMVKDYLGMGNSFARVGGDMTEWMQSGQGQQYETAAKDWLGGFLYQKSGAQITPQEFARSQSTYIPVYGDKPERLQFKAKARAIAQQALMSGLTPAQRDQAIADLAKVDGQPVPTFDEGAAKPKRWIFDAQGNLTPAP